MSEIPTDIAVEVDGNYCLGSYIEKGGMVILTSSYGTKATQAGGSPPDTLARMMLRELVTEAGK
jgi:hypothetical protein